MRNLTFSFQIVFALLLGVACVTVSATEREQGDCPAFLPVDAVAISELRLCQTADTGDSNLAVCREYSDDRQLYQLVFRGGTAPHAVHRIGTTSAGHDVAFTYHAPRLAGYPSCDLERPAGVPVNAAYLGTGVCDDDHDRPVPCSLFEHADAREPEVLRYFVYYEPDGRGVRRIETMSAGPNVHVLEAELAYQLSRALAGRDCCAEQSRSYAAHAVALFPGNTVYRDALEPPTMAASRSPSDSGCDPNTNTAHNPTY